MGNPIRVLHVVSSMRCGGIENFLMNVYRKINRDQIQFDFIVNDKSEGFFDKEIIEMGGKIHYLPKLNHKNFFSLRRKWRLFFKDHNEYRILHVHLRSYASIFLPIAKKNGLKTIIHSHSTDNDKNIFSIIKTILQFPLKYQADYFFACSEAAGKWLYGKKFEKDKNFLLVKNGIDTSKYAANQGCKDLNVNNFNLKNRFIVGHVGRFSAVKNHNFLIEIFNEICKINEKAVLLLLGDGELKSEIEKKVIKLGLKDRVVFAGIKENIADFLQIMDCFIFTSFSEGLGIAVIEAQCAGLPCFINEALPYELDINNNVYRIPLDKAASEWAEIIVKNAKKICPDIAKKNIISCGYDISTTTKMLEDFYKNIL